MPRGCRLGSGGVGKAQLEGGGAEGALSAGVRGDFRRHDWLGPRDPLLGVHVLEKNGSRWRDKIHKTIDKRQEETEIGIGTRRPQCKVTRQIDRH